jgi:hypothetical protein
MTSMSEVVVVSVIVFYSCVKVESSSKISQKRCCSNDIINIHIWLSDDM